jgi:outer membrane murein-binding lipoprotein Lpp
MDYDTLTESINTLVTSQNDWTSVAGNLRKVVSSSMGYIWGFNSAGYTFACVAPCSSGDWTPMEGLTVSDIAVDDTQVYMLSLPNMLVLPVNATNPLMVRKVPLPANANASAIFSTSTLVWIQDASLALWQCAKPCIASVWKPVANPQKIRIVSASATSLYGVDPSGTSVQTDELMTSAWKPVANMSPQTQVIGDADKLALYGIVDQTLVRCVDTCTPIPTPSQPQNVDIDPISKTVWMTDITGNIYSKIDQSADYSTLLAKISPLDKSRDTVATQVQSQQQLSGVGKLVDKLAKLIGTPAAGANAAGTNVSALESQIYQLQISSDTIIKLLLVVALTIFVYLFGTFLGRYVHTLAFAVLLVGVVYVII